MRKIRKCVSLPVRPSVPRTPSQVLVVNFSSLLLKCFRVSSPASVSLFHFKLCYVHVLAEALLLGEAWFNIIISVVILWKTFVLTFYQMLFWDDFKLG